MRDIYIKREGGRETERGRVKEKGGSKHHIFKENNSMKVNKVTMFSVSMFQRFATNFLKKFVC